MKILRSLLVVCAACLVVLAIVGWRALPASEAAVTQVQVMRGSVEPSLHVTPHLWTVNNSAKAERLYAAVQNLPRIVPGSLAYFSHCPFDNGLRYQMTFRTASGTVLRATFEASGCHRVRIDTSQLYQTDASFWQLLAGTLGMSQAQLFLTPS